MDKKTELALEALHHAMDVFFGQTGVLSRADSSLGIDRYGVVLKAIRKVVDAGLDPFKDSRFTDLWRQLIETIDVVEYKDESATPREYAEWKKFVRTVLRVCGAKLGPRGEITLKSRAKK